jgi:hypothetical protein
MHNAEFMAGKTIMAIIHLSGDMDIGYAAGFTDEARGIDKNPC